MSPENKTGVLAFFADPAATARGIRALRQEGFTGLTVYAPTPRHEITEALEEGGKEGPSPVRIWTLLGALTGLLVGFGMPIYMSLDWPLRTSGKAIVSLPAFVIIGFELTILLGTLGAVTGFFFHSRLPQLPGQMVHYDSSFSNDRFGIHVSDVGGDERLKLEAAQEILRKAGAEEVRVAGS